MRTVALLDLSNKAMGVDPQTLQLALSGHETQCRHT